MLFEVRPNLPESEVFSALNCFLRETMLATLEDRSVDETLLPNGLCASIEGNPPTRKAVDALKSALKRLNKGQKQSLKIALALSSDPCTFLTDKNTPLPVIPEKLFSRLKTLAVHLFKQTAKLKGIEEACGECIDDHYARFRNDDSPGNGNICCVCGTATLAQIQAGVEENEQWRGPYDHLLAKDRYPLFGVHPKNLLPICDTCNSKAKLAKDLLFDDKAARRLSFSPWSERAAHDEIHIRIDDTDALFPRVIVDLKSTNADRQEKLNTWDDVFKIKARVEGEFIVLKEKLAEDIGAPCQAEFVRLLRQKAATRFHAARRTPFNYWRCRVYAAISAMPQETREALRQAISTPPQDSQELNAIFF